MMYFAYGSNMDEGQMYERCPSARFVSVAALSDFRLDFTIYSPKRACGCADVVRDIGKEVYGLLYDVTESDMESLDRHENVPVAYKRVEIEVADLSGARFKAFTYEVASKKPFTKPSIQYMSQLILPARKYSFPAHYKAILEAVPTSQPFSL